MKTCSRNKQLAVVVMVMIGKYIYIISSLLKYIEIPKIFPEHRSHLSFICYCIKENYKIACNARYELMFDENLLLLLKILNHFQTLLWKCSVLFAINTSVASSLEKIVCLYVLCYRIWDAVSVYFTKTNNYFQSTRLIICFLNRSRRAFILFSLF